MSAITTHVLDTAKGRPAAGVGVVLELRDGGAWRAVGRGATDDDGRLKTLLPQGEPLAPGIYRLVFDTATYFTGSGNAAFYPEVSVTFEAREPGGHYHVPLLLSPWGFTTYRGS